MPFSKNTDVIFADGPATSPNRPPKPDIRIVMKEIEGAIDAYASAPGSIARQTLAQLNADLSPAANTMAWVYADGANSGVYRKLGAAGSGSWGRMLPLPYSFIIASDVGAGTPNAIAATTSVPVSSSSLVWLALASTNTASPVTISFNGAAPLTIKANSGADVDAGGLVAGSIVLGIVSGSTFRLLSDQAIAQSLYAARDATLAARDAAIAARNAADASADAAAASAGLAAGSANTSIQGGTGNYFGVTNGLAAVNIPNGITFFETSGYYAPGDGGGGHWVLLASGAPVAPVERTTNSGSKRWALIEPALNILQLGAKADFDVSAGTGTDNSAAILAACVAAQGPVIVPPGNYMFTNVDAVFALKKSGSFGAGKLYWKSGSTVTPIGTRVIAGVFTQSGDQNIQGGIQVGEEGPLFNSQGSYTGVFTPTRDFTAVEWQFYGNTPAFYGNGVVGTRFIDFNGGYTGYAYQLGDLIGIKPFKRKGYLARIKTIVSPTRIEVEYPDGAPLPAFTETRELTIRHAFIYARGRANVSGTTVTILPGSEPIYGTGSPAGQQFMLFGGVKYRILTVSDDKKTVTLETSPGTLVNAPFMQKVVHAQMYTTLIRLQDIRSREVNASWYFDLVGRHILRSDDADTCFVSGLPDDAGVDGFQLTLDQEGRLYSGPKPEAAGLVDNAKMTISRLGKVAAQANGAVKNICQRFYSDWLANDVRWADIFFRNNYGGVIIQAYQAGTGAPIGGSFVPEGGVAEISKGDWQNPVKIGAVYMWENAGVLRQKNGAPTSATDGTAL